MARSNQQERDEFLLVGYQIPWQQVLLVRCLSTISLIPQWKYKCFTNVHHQYCLHCFYILCVCEKVVSVIIRQQILSKPLTHKFYHTFPDIARRAKTFPPVGVMFPEAWEVHIDSHSRNEATVIQGIYVIYLRCSANKHKYWIL